MWEVCNLYSVRTMEKAWISDRLKFRAYGKFLKIYSVSESMKKAWVSEGLKFSAKWPDVNTNREQ